MQFNPFVPNGIAYPGMFIGRYDEIETIEQALFQTKNSNPQHLLLSGERGIGKSSLLFYADLVARGEISDDSVSFNFLTVSTDLAGVTTQGGVVRQIGRELLSKLRTHKTLQTKAKQVWEFVSSWEILSVKYNSKSKLIDPDQAMDELIVSLSGLVESEAFDGIAILLDEADSATIDAQLGEFVKVFTERLVKKGCSKVVLFLAGQSLLLSKLRESHESSLRVFQIVDMKPLEEKERMAIVERGLEIARKTNTQDVGITKEALEFISSLSEGYPHFIQQFSSSAFAADSDFCIDLEDVSNGAYSENGALNQLGAKFFNDLYFSKIWSEEYRKVLIFMASSGDAWVARKSIVKGCNVSESNIDNALGALKSREIIFSDDSRKGFYRIPTRSFAAWILAVSNKTP
jgi:DNA polymerase III delta prime subunit